MKEIQVKEISEDGDTIHATEYVHVDGEPEDYWPMTFEFTWKRQ